LAVSGSFLYHYAQLNEIIPGLKRVGRCMDVVVGGWRALPEVQDVEIPCPEDHAEPDEVVAPHAVEDDPASEAVHASGRDAAGALVWCPERVKEVEPVPLGKQRSRDPKDDPYLAAALAARARGTAWEIIPTMNELHQVSRGPCRLRLVALILTLGTFAGPATADVLFEDDFNRGIRAGRRGVILRPSRLCQFRWQDHQQPGPRIRRRQLAQRLRHDPSNLGTLRAFKWQLHASFPSER
jgi:hypothetical protein